MINLDHPTVKEYFEDGGDGSWRCKQTGCVVQGEVLVFYRSFGGDQYNGLTYLGLPLSNLHRRGFKDIVDVDVYYQRFERAIVALDPHHRYDNPPGAGQVYLAHRRVGQDISLWGSDINLPE